MRVRRIAVAGLGNVGQALLELIESRRPLLRERFDLDMVLVGAADSGGAVIARSGFEPEAIEDEA